MVRKVQIEDDIDELEAKLAKNVKSAKEDLSEQIDLLQSQIKGKRPKPGDPDLETKNKKYAQFLVSAINGVDLLRACLRKIFDRLKGIVMSVVNWIKRGVRGVINFIRDGFRAIRDFFN
jgi:hypothetical protein